MKKCKKAFAVCLLLAVMTVLFACGVPLNLENAKKKMKKEGYLVIDYYSYYGDEQEEIAGLLGGFVATKRSIGAGMTVLYFEDVDASKAYYNKVRDEIESAEREGSCVYWGSETAIEEFER